MGKILSLLLTLFLFSCSSPPKDINSQLIEAAKEGNLDRIKLLIAKGADINTTDSRGGTPLHWAVYYGNKEIVNFLLMQGANPEKKDINGLTPLDVARLNQKKDIENILKTYKH